MCPQRLLLFVKKMMIVAMLIVCCVSSSAAADPERSDIFAQDNLMAWCIVPFDSRKRSPEERAAMLAKLGFKQFAYDYRAEHIPTFDAEIAALKKQKIELSAWWFPGGLNDEAKLILEVIRKHEVHPQLWITGGGGPAKNAEEQAARVKGEADRIRPLAEAAAKLGCKVGLYNHGGWFGEPENQIAIIEELKLPNVGIVYNQHHGHDHLEKFPKLLKLMLPHLYVLNLNGMVSKGDQQGRKILPLAQGELDLELLRTIRDSGYRGPIGILGHTQDDAEARLLDNLDGLRWLEKQLNGQAPGEKPIPRTPVPGLKTPPVTAAGVSLTIPVEFNAEVVAELVTQANTAGDAKRGARVFQSAKFACQSCHAIGPHGGLVGPALSDVGKRMKPMEIAESLLWPKRLVKPEFVAWRIYLEDGRSFQGYKRSESPESTQLFDPTTQQTHTLARKEIEEEQAVGTLMPDGLAHAMSPVQRRDVFRFLLDLGNDPHLEKEIRPYERPAEFTFDRAPLNREAAPLWEHPVNRGRLYDYYRKEALFFRGRANLPHLLPAFPGLDGGKLGHWGNQNDTVWKNDRWNKTELGTVLSGVFHGPGLVVPKSVCVRLGEQGELAACFNPETLCFEALWEGGFLKFNDVRHGFMDGLRPAGEMLPKPDSKKPEQPFEYHGFYRFGKRVVFAYRVGDVEFLDAPWVTNGKFERVVAPVAEHPLKHVVQGGTAQWPHEIATAGKLGTGKPYAVDTIALPIENSEHSLFFFGDHDFLPDGSALLCTMQGEVWRASGLDSTLQNVRWRRFASGLHQAQGMIVTAGQIYVLGRDQITRLHDLNGDGEADYYECFSNRQKTSPGGHDFICGLVRDSPGCFYTASGNEGLIRISADGRNVETLATGFRNPDGLGIYPDGCITVPCSEGNWTPASMICLVKPNSTAPGKVPHFGYQGPRENQPPSLPLVYLPRGLDNSSGGQIAVPDDRWGPLKGNMIHFSFGQGTHYLLLRDEVAGQPQGAIVPLTGEFLSGAHRGKFNPQDGQLYVSGMAGWGTYTPEDGCFQRVRYTGERVQLPKAFHLHENGVLVEFTADVDSTQLADLNLHFAQCWNYRYSPGYGSPEFSPSHTGGVGHDPLEIVAVHKIDSRRVFVELPDLQPVNQLHLLLQVDSGPPQELIITAHKLDPPFSPTTGYVAPPKLIAAHPQAIDLAMLGKTKPNPWKDKLPTKRELTIEAGKNLTYSTRMLRATAGEKVKLTFLNPDVVPHNWVLVKPGSLMRVGGLANQLVSDPEAFMRQYAPASDDVLVYTDIVSPLDQFTIYFEVPKEKGRYPYLCTFPGHWMVMNGELIVE